MPGCGPAGRGRPCPDPGNPGVGSGPKRSGRPFSTAARPARYRRSRVSAVYTAPPRQSFVAAIKDIPEVWEIIYADDHFPVYSGPMHDYRMDEVSVIDKRTLEIVQTLRPSPGKTTAHVELDRYGKYALLSVSEPAPDGAPVIYDAATLKEIKRLPMNKPSGKYNVYNKINRSEGTSHRLESLSPRRGLRRKEQLNHQIWRGRSRREHRRG